MTRLILSTLIVATLAANAPTFAAPQYGNALKKFAGSSITPHGVWDGK